jgi:hypothetical protein
LPHSGKKAAFFTLFYQSKTVSSQFLLLPICRQEGIWSFEVTRRRPREFSPSHKRNKIIARKIGSFLGAEANKSKDEHDDEDEDDSLISGSGLKATLVQSRSEGLT